MPLSDLFKPKWKRSNPKVRLAAVNDLNDPAILAEIAMTDWSNDVSRAAVQKISDKSLLADIALNKRGALAGIEEAVKRIDNQEVLSDIIKVQCANGRSATFGATVIKPAVDKITDPEILADLAVTTKEFWVIDKMTDPDALVDLARKTNSYYALEKAIEVVIDQDTLYFLYHLSRDHISSIRLAAVNKINNQQNLYDIATQDKDRPVRDAALNKITESYRLAQIAGSNNDISVDAVEKISDPDLLSGIARNGANFAARRAAIKKMTDQAALRAMASQISDSAVLAEDGFGLLGLLMAINEQLTDKVEWNALDKRIINIREQMPDEWFSRTYPEDNW